LQEKNSVALELETAGYGFHLCAQVPNPDIVVVPGGIATDALMGDKTILQWLCKVFQFQYPSIDVFKLSLICKHRKESIVGKKIKLSIFL
jgi:hypothetical protein